MNISSKSTVIDASPATGTRRALVVLPTYDERQNIGVMIEMILAASAHVEILVIDDNSPDATAEVVRTRQLHDPRIHLIVRAGKLGLGSAYLLGFNYAIEHDFATVVTMDADRSHDPRHLDAIYALHENGFDLIIGSRYVGGGKIHRWNALRKLNSAAANVLARRIVGKHIRDCTSGYRSYSSALLKRIGTLQLESHGYSMLVELLYEAVLAKARISEIPIHFHNRVAGDSKISWREVSESLLTLARLKLRQIRLARAEKVVEPA
ncbi:MAG: polyprenol monophosphomannose synthase [Vulcanimicrobiaceae bacterium]